MDMFSKEKWAKLEHFFLFSKETYFSFAKYLVFFSFSYTCPPPRPFVVVSAGYAFLFLWRSVGGRRRRKPLPWVDRLRLKLPETSAHSPKKTFCHHWVSKKKPRIFFVKESRVSYAPPCTQFATSWEHKKNLPPPPLPFLLFIMNDDEHNAQWAPIKRKEKKRRREKGGGIICGERRGRRWSRGFLVIPCSFLSSLHPAAIMSLSPPSKKLSGKECRWAEYSIMFGRYAVNCVRTTVHCMYMRTLLAQEVTLK